MTTKTKKDLMGTDQFAELVSAVVRNLPKDLTVAESQRWIHGKGQKELAKALRRTLKPTPKWEIYLHPCQKDGGTIKGFDLLKHLEETGRINRAYSLDSPLVQGWIENPETYPDEFKDKSVFLWGSRREFGGYPEVAYLVWRGARVVVYWLWLERLWDGHDPALLEVSSEL